MKYRHTVYVASAIVIIGSVMLVRKDARAERRQIRKDARLDIAAIEAASDVVRARIRQSESLRDLGYWVDELENEIAFQKIAIREE